MDINSFNSSLIPAAARGMCVLVVDHDTTSLMYIASVLEEQLYKVRTTELASVALSMIEQEEYQFDLVMADVGMPEMDIFTFLECILLKRDMPIILMSHGANMNTAKKALGEGACFFLEKPIRTQDLINVWQHVYRKRSCRRMEIRKEDSTARVAAKNDLHGIENENSFPANIEWLDDMSRGAAGDYLDGVNDKNLPLVDKGKGKQVLEFKRRRVTGDEDGKGSAELKSDLKESNSKSKKTIDGEGEREEKESSNTGKKSRMHWTPELHLKFMEAISVLGEEKAHPKAVLEMMNVPNMTQRHVASHLQKYRDRVKRVSDFCAYIPPVVQSKMTGSSFQFYSGNGFPQNLEQHNAMKSSQGLVNLNSGIGAATKDFTPPAPLASPNLCVGSSTEVNYADLSTNFSEKAHLYHASNFNKAQVASSGEVPDGYAENFSYEIPELASPLDSVHTYQYTKAMPNVHKPFEYTRELNAPNSFHGLTQKRDSVQSQICSSSPQKPSSFPRDFRDASQEGLATPSCKLNSTDYGGQMGEFEVFNGQLNAGEIDSFSEWIGTPSNSDIHFLQ